ncbi:MAG: hypothetical protein QG632_820, partial [Candidatus Dependentiae bacterium]|nr:hypothetical protein [Candidatus Dependentiae bacterium]
MIFSMIVLSLALNATWCVATPPEKQFWETKKAYYGSAGLLGMGAAYGVYKLLFNKKRSAALGKFFSRDGGGFFRGLMARLEDPEVKASSRWLAGTLLMAYVSARLAAKGSSLKGSSLPDAASHTAVMARQSEIVQQIAAQNDRMRLAIVEQEQIMKKDQQDLRAKENALADELRREEEAHRERFEQQRHILEAQERKREEDHKHDLEMKQRKIDQLE